MTDSAEETRIPPLESRPKVRRLTNSREVRRLLARLIEQTWAGSIDTKTANSLTYQLSTAAKVINDEQVLALSKRIAALEERAGAMFSGKYKGRRLDA